MVADQEMVLPEAVWKLIVQIRDAGDLRSSRQIVEDILTAYLEEDTEDDLKPPG